MENEQTIRMGQEVSANIREAVIEWVEKLGDEELKKQVFEIAEEESGFDGVKAITFLQDRYPDNDVYQAVVGRAREIGEEKLAQEGGSEA